jgi:flagellar motor switch protein FliN/FliY
MDKEKEALEQESSPVGETGAEAPEPAEAAVMTEPGGESCGEQTGGGRTQLEMIGDVSLPLTIELGCTRSAIKDILQFAPGTVIELDKAAGDPVDIYLYETRIAEGEIVIVKERYAVKITSIVNKSGRIRDIRR